MFSSSLFFFLLITLLSADALIFGFTYGLDRVRIPFLSILLISVISALMLTLSFICGEQLLMVLPGRLRSILPFTVLLFLALYKLYDAFPILHQKKSSMTTETLAQKINSHEVKTLSACEAVLLAITLSIDNISAGLSMGSCPFSFLNIFVYSALIHAAAILSGYFAGHFFSNRCSHQLSLISALLLLLLAFVQLL